MTAEMIQCATCSKPYRFEGIRCIAKHPPDVCCHYMQTCGTCGLSIGPASACQRCFRTRPQYEAAPISHARYRGGDLHAR